MKKLFTLKSKYPFRLVQPVILGSVLFTFLFWMGCYEWRNIIQPETTSINSYFDVYLVAQDDGNPDNDWTNPDNHDIGLFGAMIPVGWTVEDSIYYFIKTTEPGYDNDGILIWSAEHSQTLTDSIPPPFGYYWWGAKTDGEASMVYFDSLYFTPRIFTNEMTGTFYLRYAIGDENYWDRNPADDVSDPIAITAIDYTGVEELLSGSNISLYPNPASDVMNISFNQYRNQVVDMQVVDITGKIILSRQLFEASNRIAVDNLTEGMYFVKLQNGDDVNVQKILIR